MSLLVDVLTSALLAYGRLEDGPSSADLAAERLYHCPVARIVLAMPSNKLVCLDGAK